MWSKQADVSNKNMTSFKNKISNRKRKNTNKPQGTLAADGSNGTGRNQESVGNAKENAKNGDVPVTKTTPVAPKQPQPPSKNEKSPRHSNCHKIVEDEFVPGEKSVVVRQNRPEREDSIKRYSDSFIFDHQVVIDGSLVRTRSGIVKDPVEDRVKGRRFSDIFRHSSNNNNNSHNHNTSAANCPTERGSDKNQNDMVNPQVTPSSKSRKKRNKKENAKSTVDSNNVKNVSEKNIVKVDNDSYLKRVKSKIYSGSKSKNEALSNGILPNKPDNAKTKSKGKKTESNGSNMTDFRKSLSSFDFRLTRQHSNLEWIRPRASEVKDPVVGSSDGKPAVPLLTKAKSSSAINLSLLRMRRGKLMDYARNHHRISESVHDEFDFIAYGSVTSLIDVKPGQPVSRSGSDRRPDSSQDQTTRNAEGAAQDHAQDTISPPTESGANAAGGSTGASHKRKAATNINRSESVKEVSEKRKQRRNISDPSHNSHHVDFEQTGAPTPLMSASTISHTTDSGSSSNSSISCNGRLSESPSNSAEVLSNLMPGNSDSDMDAEDTTPNWQELVPEEQLKNLKPHEKKRQDVINEFFQTEESHVRSLRALYKIFYKTLHENQTLKSDELHLVFPNIKEVLDIHTNISREMKKKRKEDPLVRQLGDLVSAMFDERLSKAAATFCERQQQALDFIKERRKRDSKFDGVLCECEKKRQCRRLPLQGILPAEMQRLSKYPLLLERLIGSVEEENVEELTKLKRAHQDCKDILNRVNEAAKLASNKARLEEIQRHLDTSNFERAVENLAPEFRSVDLTRYTYVLEGPMQLRRPNKGPVPVHILLLEEAVVLLQREGERFVLKFFQSGSSAQPMPLSPIIKMSTLLVRTNAVHKSALFLVNTSTNNSQMYDLIAEDDHKREQWFKHFSDASDSYNRQEGKTKRPESAGDLPSDGLSQDSGHESVEEIPQPENAVAECTSSSVDDVEPQASTDNSSPDVTGEGEGDGTDTSTKVGPEDWPLVEPSQVQVLTAPVHVAESKLTPLEQIRRKDEQVRQALEAKEALVADLLNIPREHFSHIADMAGETRDDVTDLILAAIHQSNQLHVVINSASNVTEGEAVAAAGGLPTCASQENLHRLQQAQPPAVPCHALLPIATALSSQFTALLSAAKRLEEERDRYRKEVHRLRERLHQDNELHVSASVTNPVDDADQTTEDPKDNTDPEVPAPPSE